MNATVRVAPTESSSRCRSDARGVVVIEPPGMKGYLPIAAGYLVASAQADERLREAFDFKLILHPYNHPFEEVLQEAIDAQPDVIAFSCQGWAVLRADALAKRLRELFPEALIIYGGNHVSNQGAEFFKDRPFANVLVNGEGESTFKDILLCRLDDDRNGLANIPGLAWRNLEGTIECNADRPRISELGELPSPYLTGVLKPDARLHSTALLETNRGCPYQCSFCYWGTATQSKIRAFPIDRLRAEMELLAAAEIDTWFVADANFGVIKQDLEIVNMIVDIKQRYGFPNTINTNWAKHSNERVIKICATLNDAGIHSSFTLAQQSTDPHTLDLANRKNMSINKVDEISRLCRLYSVIPKGELIWGLPGEDYNTFLRSYDDLAQFTDTLSVYPLYILPNTEYSRRIDEYKIKTKRVEIDTVYEYCVEHQNMTEEDFLRGVKFIISNNILRVAGNFLYTYPRVAKNFGVLYSSIIELFGPWVMKTANPFIQRFRKYYRFPLASHRQSLQETWNALIEDRDAFLDAVSEYLEETFHADMAPSDIRVLRQALQFDFHLYPIVDTPELELTSKDGFYQESQVFDYDLLRVYQGLDFDPEPVSISYNFMRPAGFGRYPVENWYFGLISYRAKVKESWRNVSVLAE